MKKIKAIAACGLVQPPTASITVTVVDVPKVAAPFMWQGKQRVWNWLGLPAGVELEFDGLEVTATTNGYTIKRNEILEDIRIVARLKDGPILQSLPTKGFWLRDVVEGEVFVADKFEDGSKETNDTLFGVQAPEDMVINVRTISGVTFDDGSRVRLITKDEFDKLEQFTLILYKSAGRSGANCHWYKVLQNGVLVGEMHR